MEKKKIIQRIKTSLKSKNVKEIRTAQSDSNKTRELSYKWNKKKFQPDVVAIYDKKKDLFCVEQKISKKNISDLISKWILFSLEARRSGGKFYLVVPAKHNDYCKEIIEDKKLSANLLPGLT